MAAQVCRCLGIKDTSTAIKQLKQRMKVVDDFFENRDTVSNCSPNRGITFSDSPKARNITLQDGKNHTQVTIIPESWLYELIFASRKQSAIVFRAWVTHEVLPSLRKHGSYRMEGKLIRRELTDVIKKEIVDKTDNQNVKKFAYCNYTKMIIKSLGLEGLDRNDMTSEQLEQLAHRENLVSALINEGKSYEQIKQFIFAA